MPQKVTAKRVYEIEASDLLEMQDDYIELAEILSQDFFYEPLDSHDLGDATGLYIRMHEKFHNELGVWSYKMGDKDLIRVEENWEPFIWDPPVHP